MTGINQREKSLSSEEPGVIDKKKQLRRGNENGPQKKNPTASKKKLHSRMKQRPATCSRKQLRGKAGRKKKLPRTKNRGPASVGGVYPTSQDSSPIKGGDPESSEGEY